MTEFSTMPVSDFIGALELSDMSRFDDAALEMASGYIAVGPTTGCPPAPTVIMCRRIDDDALESTGLSAGPQPTLPSGGCGLPPTIIACGRIDDGALESAAEMMASGPTEVACFPTRYCPRIGDDALELAGLLAGPVPTQNYNGCGIPPTIIGCHRIDDGALEAVAAEVGPPPPTMPRQIPGGTCLVQ